MTNIKSYTDIEQSKKLAEILPLESADMHYNNGSCRGVDYTEHFSAELMPYQEALHLMKIHKTNFMFQVIPCWSLAALINLLPSDFTEVGKHSTTTYKIDIRKYKFTNEVDLHQIAYGSYKWYEDGKSYTWSDMINTGEKENLIDAVFQMVVWLKENNKL